MTGDLLDRATHGEDVQVDSATIEQTLSELWRVEKSDEHAVTRAALWNVVAHTSSAKDHGHASEILSKAAASVPQRTIAIRADPAAHAEMTSWISANCHLLGEGKQVCSEEVAIVAGGDRVSRVPPLVRALLIPDMPVAVWWVGDLPQDGGEYFDALLEPADRLIVDSVHFDHRSDLELLDRLARQTTTVPADLNWLRLEEWRMAAASVFDATAMRSRLKLLRRLHVRCDTVDERFFGNRVEPLLFTAWLLLQAGLLRPDGSTDVECSTEFTSSDRNGLSGVQMDVDGVEATIIRDPARSVLTTTVDGQAHGTEAVTRTIDKDLHRLVVRVLNRPGTDHLLLKVLPAAIAMARKISA